jgi:hypothetical protein
MKQVTSVASNIYIAIGAGIISTGLLHDFWIYLGGSPGAVASSFFLLLRQYDDIYKKNLNFFIIISELVHFCKSGKQVQDIMRKSAIFI